MLEEFLWYAYDVIYVLKTAPIWLYVYAPIIVKYFGLLLSLIVGGLVGRWVNKFHTEPNL